MLYISHQYSKNDIQKALLTDIANKPSSRSNITSKSYADIPRSPYPTKLTIHPQNSRSTTMPSGISRKSAEVSNEQSVDFARDPAAYIAQQVRAFKLEKAAGAAVNKAPAGGYLAGKVDGICVKDFAVSGGDRAKEG